MAMLKALHKKIKELKKFNFFLILKRLRRGFSDKTPRNVSCSQVYNCFYTFKVGCFLFSIQIISIIYRNDLNSACCGNSK